MAEDELFGCHRWLNVDGFEQAPGVGDGQGGKHVAVHGVTMSQTRLSD